MRLLEKRVVKVQKEYNKIDKMVESIIKNNDPHMIKSIINELKLLERHLKAKILLEVEKVADKAKKGV